MTKKAIVFGATGNSGVKICEELSSLNIEHTAFIRKGSESKLTTKDSSVIYGDVLQKVEVEKALQSSKFTDIIIALGSRDLKESKVRSQGTKNIVDVLTEKSRSIKIHMISAHGVGESWSQLKSHERLLSKLFLGKTMKDHELQEEIVKKNYGGFHIIRPVALKNGEATGKIYSQNEGKLPHGDITRADLAIFIVENMVEGSSGIISVCRK